MSGLPFFMVKPVLPISGVRKEESNLLGNDSSNAPSGNGRTAGVAGAAADNALDPRRFTSKSADGPRRPNAARALCEERTL